MQLHTFQVDVTPPVGVHVSGWLDPAIGVETPLYVRGVILCEGDTRCVIAVADFCYTCGRSHERIEQALASAAGVSVSHATLHSNHVHEAPMIYEQAWSVVDEFAPGQGARHPEQYFQSMLADTHTAIRDALAKPAANVPAVSFAEHTVDKFASTRRCLDEDNHCHIRWSRDNPLTGWLRDYPEGPIDPVLSQIVFYGDGDQAVCCMNFYACHPQVSNGRALWSGDTVAVAIKLFEHAHPGVFPMYFDGCDGDVTAGKYTSNIPLRDQYVFGTRLFDAMHGAFAKHQPQPLQRVRWRDNVVTTPPGIWCLKYPSS